MEFLNTLAKTPGLPAKSLKELEVDHQYAISDVRKTFTKYGEKVKMTLDDSFIVYLPSKVNKYLIDNPESFDIFLNETESKQVFLKYLGNFLIEFV